ncbi:MAG: methyltransferase domain-containing protein [Chitinophagaceae bacterium]|nr:methyltransferase domain-containing protein [Chitinophagaceae bacterium]
MNSATQKKSFFQDKDYHAFTALEKAHFISFAPYAFQASVLLRDYGILNKLQQDSNGCDFETLKSEVSVSAYGLRILLEAGIGIGLLFEEEGKYFITKTGMMFISDAMVRINTDFMRDICYEGAGKLKESIEEGKPKGLPYLGPWDTLYEGLSVLPPKEKTSWFNFDHYYSDYVFPLLMPYVFQSNPKHILDIGANTGKFTIQCLQYNAEVEMHLLDLPGQLQMAKKNIEEAGFPDRFELIAHNILDNNLAIPGQYDIIWMSQFLDCFSDEEIVHILGKCKQALAPGGKILINETFWDKQPFHSSMYSLQMTSLYFTTIANGNSQMYDSRVFIKLMERAGLKIESIEHKIGTTHSLITASVGS